MNITVQAFTMIAGSIDYNISLSRFIYMLFYEQVLLKPIHLCEYRKIIMYTTHSYTAVNLAILSTHLCIYKQLIIQSVAKIGHALLHIMQGYSSTQAGFY